MSEQVSSRTTGIILGSLFGALITMYIMILCWLKYKHQLSLIQLWRFINLERGQWYYARECTPFNGPKIHSLNDSVKYTPHTLFIGQQQYAVNRYGMVTIGRQSYHIILTGNNKFGLLEGNDWCLYTLDHENNIHEFANTKPLEFQREGSNLHHGQDLTLAIRDNQILYQDKTYTLKEDNMFARDNKEYKMFMTKDGQTQMVRQT